MRRLCVAFVALLLCAAPSLLTGADLQDEALYPLCSEVDELRSSLGPWKQPTTVHFLLDRHWSYEKASSFCNRHAAYFYRFIACTLPKDENLSVEGWHIGDTCTRYAGPAASSTNINGDLYTDPTNGTGTPRDICALLKSTRDCWPRLHETNGAKKQHIFIILIEDSDAVLCNLNDVMREFSPRSDVAAFIVGGGATVDFERHGNKPAAVIANWTDIEPSEHWFHAYSELGHLVRDWKTFEAVAEIGRRWVQGDTDSGTDVRPVPATSRRNVRHGFHFNVSENEYTEKVRTQEPTTTGELATTGTTDETVSPSTDEASAQDVALPRVGIIASRPPARRAGFNHQQTTGTTLDTATTSGARASTQGSNSTHSRSTTAISGSGSSGSASRSTKPTSESHSESSGFFDAVALRFNVEEKYGLWIFVGLVTTAGLALLITILVCCCICCSYCRTAKGRRSREGDSQSTKSQRPIIKEYTPLSMETTQRSERQSAEPAKSTSEANPLLPEPELASDPPPPVVQCSMPNVPDDGQWKNVLMPLITPITTTPSKTGTDNWVTAPTHPYQSPPASIHATSPTADLQGTRSPPQNAVSLRLSDSDARP